MSDHAAPRVGEHASAHELLSRALKTHIENARKAAERVRASGLGRRTPPKSIGGAITAGEADDEEAVHDFRVALRRLRTALKPAREVYGKKKLKAIGADLKRFADVTSALRDEEVLRDTLASLELSRTARAQVNGWVERRARQERSRRAGVVRVLCEDGGGDADIDASASASSKSSDDGAPPTLEDCLKRLEKRLDAPKRAMSGAELGRRSLTKARDDLGALREADPADGAAMHQLRIRFKRLRYTAELFKPVLGETASRVASEASRVQSSLGHLHDLDEAMVRMTRAWGLTARSRGAVLAALRAARTARSQRCGEDLIAAEVALGSALGAQSD